MPSVVLALAGMFLWNQNNERRFGAMEGRITLIEQRVVATTALVTELTKAQIEVALHAERIAAIVAVIHKIEQHLEHTDASIATINREYEGLKWIKPDAWKRVPQP